MTRLAIIGAGNMGQYSARALSKKVEEISVYDSVKSPTELKEAFRGVSHRIYENVGEAVKDADFVLYCIPTDEVERSMKESLPSCKPGAIISGQTSRKTPERKAFDEYTRLHPGSGLEMVTIHTMCNPKSSDPSQEILAIIPNGCSDGAYSRAVEFYGGMSGHVEHFRDVEEHDNILANTQVNTSRTNLSIASAFAQAGCFPWINGSYGNGLDVMKFSLAMRTANLPGHVYKWIQIGNEHGQNLVALSANVGSALLTMVRDPEMFEKRIERNVLEARRKLFGDGKRETILRDEDVERFNIGKALPNSQIALILYALDDAIKERNIFAYMKGTTPMHTSLLCLTDYLFNKDGLLEESLDAIRKGVTLEDDVTFFNEWLAWEEAIRLQEPGKYDVQHGKMSEQLRKLVTPKQMQTYLDTSKEVVALCRQRMQEAVSSGKIEVPS
ncbi:MAG: NAD(P)-binding domain-containing protein [Candidatus Woesearchaeota archaeon]